VIAHKLKFCMTTEGFNALKHVFPDANHLSWKSAQTKLRNISGLTPILYDCCINSCCCYSGPNANKTSCPYCNEDRYDARKHPRRRFSYIPLIPCLQAFLRNQEMATKMQYRGKFEHNPTKIQDIFDGKLYRLLLGKHVRSKDRPQRHTYFDDLRNIALGLSTDGYAPFKRWKKTAWPLLLFNYNLPPDIRFHDENILFLGVIPGPNKPHDFDSFIWPLLEELLQLEMGVDTWDSLEKKTFKLRAFLLIVFGNIPTVSMVMRMKGHNGRCPCRFCKIVGV
jgi:hypothetical protein